jgi:hypothetical protein
MVRFIGNGKSEEPETVDQEVLGTMMNHVQDIIKKHHETTNSLQKRLERRVAEVKWGNPARAPIQVRREGWLQRPNRRDLARVDAAKAADDLAILLANILKNHARLGVYGHHIATEAKKVMVERNYDLPEEVIEYGALLEELNSELIAQTVAEVMTMYPEIILRETSRAMNQQ